MHAHGVLGFSVCWSWDEELLRRQTDSNPSALMFGSEFA